MPYVIDHQQRIVRPAHLGHCILTRAVVLIALFAAALPSTPVRPAGASEQGTLSLGIDAVVEGNGPTSIAEIDDCVSVHSGDSFEVDVYIRDVEDLLAWQVYIQYDPAIVQPTKRDVQMFLAGNAGSSVLDVSSRLPEGQGLYNAAAADTSDPPTPDSGSGVLLRLSMKAIKDGASDLELTKRDVNQDGAIDIGPLLRNFDAEALGDDDGDGIFDGPVHNASVEVGERCRGGNTSNGGSDGGGLGAAAIAVIAGVSVAAVLAGAGAFFYLRRRG